MTSGETSAVSAELDRRYPTAALDLLKALVAISSPSGDPGGLEAACRCLAAALDGHGLRVEIRQEESEEGALPLLLVSSPTAADTPLLFLGHLDTVLPAVPWRCHGGRLYATGACDMKGGLAALVGALDLMRARGQRPPPDFLLAVVPDEEVMGPICRRVTRQLGARARAVAVLEPGEPHRDGGETIVTGRRGMFQWRLEARGVGAHAGNDYWRGRSALLAAAAWSGSAAGMSRAELGPTVSPSRLVAGDADFVAHLAAEAAILGTPRRLNVVPDRAVVEGEARFLRAREGEMLRRRLDGEAQRVAAERGVAMTFEITAQAPPLSPDGPGKAWAGRAVSIAARRGLRLHVDGARGGLSFPNLLADPMAVPVLDGLGPVGGGMHTAEEFVDLQSFARRVVLLADLLAADTALAADGSAVGDEGALGVSPSSRGSR